MRIRNILAVSALATVAIIGLGSTAANAADPVTSDGSITTTTYAQGWSGTHQFNVTFTCGTDANGKTVTNGSDAGSPTGSGTLTSVVLTPDSNGGGAFAFSGGRDNYAYNYAGTYAPGGAWVAPTTATAGSNGIINENYEFGTAGNTYAAGDYAHFGSVTGSFANLPTCPTPEVPPVVAGNHGEYVSGATHAGVKGKDLAAIAKNVTLVGPYKF